MNHIDSDLEEGEIPDDSPSSPHVAVKKDRDLPRRYILRENKSTHKHKKDCKYAIRYHAKKLAKLKKTPVRVSSKKHRKSCPHDKSNIKHSNPKSDHLIKNGHSFSKHSLISEINCSFKDLLVKKQNLNSNTSSPQISLSETNMKLPNDNFSTNQTNENNKSDLKITNDTMKDSQQHECFIEKQENLSHLKELDNSNKMKEPAVTFHCTPKADSEESEDEEELRRIALATCAKRKLQTEPYENTSQIVDSNVPVPESSVGESQSMRGELCNLVLDNYEVVDMEVDDDAENSVESVDNESLFIIDTKPSSKLNEIIKNSASEVQSTENASDDDFEADILRAELIGSMFRKKALLEEQLDDVKTNSNKFPKRPIVSKSKISVQYQKPKLNLQRKPLQPAKRIFGKNGMNKSAKLKCNSVKLTQNTQIIKSPKRLIISLNGESSSEESDNAEEVNAVPENPVASIEALISDCRQKSNSNEKCDEVVKHVPKALSCLSKAQQEEYNSLLKILAEKKKLPVSQQTFQHNNSVHSPSDDIKLLEGKLAKFNETLQKKKLLMTNISKDVDEKQQVYMKSKLSAQLLKEQYVAAEKVRRIKLDEWSKSCKNLEVVKKSISSLESKIIQLQNLCTKLGSSVQGHAYNLSSLPVGNGLL